MNFVNWFLIFLLEMLEVSGTLVDFVAFLFSLVFCYWYDFSPFSLFSLFISPRYLQGKHWIANNIFGFAFSLQAISFMNLGSYQVGCILLVEIISFILEPIDFCISFRQDCSFTTFFGYSEQMSW